MNLHSRCFLILHLHVIACVQDRNGSAAPHLNNPPSVIIRRPRTRTHTRPRSASLQHTSSDTCFSGSFSSWRNLHLKWSEFPQQRPKRLSQPLGLWCLKGVF